MEITSTQIAIGVLAGLCFLGYLGWRLSTIGRDGRDARIIARREAGQQ